MGRWTKKTLPMAELLRLGLTPEEGFVLSRLDTAQSPTELVTLTGLPIGRVEEILGSLGTKGAAGSDHPNDPLLVSDGPPGLEALTTEGEAPEPAFDADAEGDAVSPDADPIAAAEREEEVPKEEPEDVSYRKIYETEIRKLERDERIVMAHHASGPRLMALCYDVDPGVISAILENPHSGLTHARLAARHHGTSAGLEHIAKNQQILADTQVQRAMIRNPHLSETLCRKILSSKRMSDAYKASIDVDIPERTRAFARGVLRAKFATSQGEERAGLIMVTEGRVLQVLTGLTLDGRATSILCSRQYTSALFVQNLARWGPCPPILLAHLLKQSITKRQQPLRNMILRHPNLPADAKRKL
jgi:hypothetical protein